MSWFRFQDNVRRCKGCGDRRYFPGDLCVWCRTHIQNPVEETADDQGAGNDQRSETT
jgi:hypothetical protein